MNPMGVVVCVAGIQRHKDHLSRLAVKLRGKADAGTVKREADSRNSCLGSRPCVDFLTRCSEYPTFYVVRAAIPAINK